MKFGIDRLLVHPALRAALDGKRVALLAHPASVTEDLPHILDALTAAGVHITAVFGPQPGVRGYLQANMMASPGFPHPPYGIPLFRTYVQVGRRLPPWSGPLALGL